ncbi:hypothetical protein JCM19314_2124 [Nonlabens ulvanivorans]|uniref:Uncharacterized protein n=1 Tax=Nonlabens ulvanivorans TaxID=906888 RepID=A0A090QC56_NONUL|nr:hypothetical protein JCM19314_2124 [Nonlabens ulvanivorans]
MIGFESCRGHFSHYKMTTKPRNHYDLRGFLVFRPTFKMKRFAFIW